MGRLGGKGIALVSVYSPNVEKGDFLMELSRKLADYLVCPVIVGGNFYCAADPGLDMSYPPLSDSPANRLAGLF